jgi:hypothetical protein
MRTPGDGEQSPSLEFKPLGKDAAAWENNVASWKKEIQQATLQLEPKELLRPTSSQEQP